jgi:aryl-alcohol dehydrogenase-like predicted oxidoreductase
MATLSVAITSVIFAASRLEQLTDTLADANYKLDSAVKATLDDVSIEYRSGEAGK